MQKKKVLKDLKFNDRCYEILKLIPCGKLSTYKEIALALNCKAYRAVGNAMNKNPNAPKVPCHRIVSSNGDLGGYAFGVKAKENILKGEGIIIENGKIINLDKYLINAVELKADLKAKGLF